MKKAYVALLLTVVLVCLTLPMVSAETVNLLKNPGAEQPAGDWTSGWGRAPVEKVTCNTDLAHVRTGSASIKLTTDTGDYPRASRRVSGIAPGAEYSFGVWIKTMNTCTSFSLKLESYDKDNGTTSQDTFGIYNEKSDGWTEISCTFRPPLYTTSIVLYLRMYGTGTVYCDDAYCVLVAPPERIMDLDTDKVFYYSEECDGNSGTATAVANTAYHTDLIGKDFRFRLTKGTVVLKEESVTVNGMFTAFSFPLSLLQEKQAEYVVTCTLLDTGGNTEAELSQKVYRYDRPKYLRADGAYVQDNQVFNPVYIYHVALKDLDVLQKAGINLVQGYASRDWLDALHARGMKAIVVLYAGDLSAGNPSRLSVTKKYVADVWEHPAVFAWAVKDEPKDSDAMLEELRQAYIAIRTIDPNHPVWITANGKFETIGKYCDVLSDDAYPQNNALFTTRIYTNTLGALAAVNNAKPVYELLQVTPLQNALPTPNQLTNMLYQALWGGAKGVGYFDFSSALVSGTLWDAITSFGTKERELAFDLFAHNTYPLTGEANSGDVFWKKWTAQGDIVFAAMNRTNDVAQIEIPDSTITGQETAAGIGNSAEVTLSAGKATVTLAAAQTVLYRIVEEENVRTVRFFNETSEITALTNGAITARYVAPAQGLVQTGTMLSALYEWVDDGYKLTSLSPITKAKTASALSMECTLSVQNAKDSILKTFVWDNMNSLQPKICRGERTLL